MPTIAIGTQGDQWFPINQTGVSRKHAFLTIPDNQNDPWILEDNHSTNGTFIRDENGQMIRISLVEIPPMTFIQLGPNDVRGCSFYVTKCLASRQQNPQKHQKEFDYIRQELNWYESLCKKEKKIKKWRRLVNRYSWTIVVGVMVILDTWIEKSISFRWVRYIPVIAMAIVSWICNKKSKLDLAKKRMDATRRCPNPECIHNLSDQEIINGQCNKCGAQI